LLNIFASVELTRTRIVAGMNRSFQSPVKHYLAKGVSSSECFCLRAALDFKI